MKYIAIIAEDRQGPAYGVGTTEAEARKNAAEFGFEDGAAIEITKNSYDAIQAGNPDAVEEA